MTSNLDLTPAQIKAAGTEAGRVYIEAEPGSGKTVIAAERFGVHRYTSRGTSEPYSPSASIELQLPNFENGSIPGGEEPR